MARYLLDTTVLVDYTKGQEAVATGIIAMLDSGDDVVVCAVTIGELYSGFTSDQVREWETPLERLRYCGISREAAIAAGQERYWFARRGRQISLADALIAATAREQQAILVTDNLRHFSMMDIETLSLRG